MHTRSITEEWVTSFGQYLRQEERSAGTIEKYLRDVRAFAAWLGGTPLTKEAAALWKGGLLDQGCTPATVNSKLAAINKFFSFAGWAEFRVKPLKIQRRLFRDDSRELTRAEYLRLLETARALGRERLALLMETICATGIRVSEVQNITVEAARRGKTEIALKGKIRTILLPGKLCRKLLKYARKRQIASGRDISDQRRQGHVPGPDLGGDEGPVPRGRRGRQQGVSAQSAASLRQDLLQGIPGCGQAGGRAGAQQPGDDPDLSDFHRRGTRRHAGGASPFEARQNSYIVLLPPKKE